MRRWRRSDPRAPAAVWIALGRGHGFRRWLRSDEQAFAGDRR